MAVEFGVLGPVQVLDGGVTRPITAAKQRTALAVLLLRVNAVVPMDVLIESLWPDQQPPAPRGALHTHLMRLRRTLGPRRGRVSGRRAPDTSSTSMTRSWTRPASPG